MPEHAGSHEGLGAGPVVVLLAVSMASQLPSWATILMLVVGVLIMGSWFGGPEANGTQPDKEPTSKTQEKPAPGKVFELLAAADLRLLAMQAKWGTWPDNAAEAMVGEACALRARVWLKGAAWRLFGQRPMLSSAQAP